MVVVVVPGAFGAVDLNGLLNTNSVLVRGADARSFDGGLVDVDGLLDNSGPTVVVVVAVDGGLVYADGLLVGSRSAVGSVDSGLVYTNSLLERRSGTAVCSVDSGFVYTNSLLDNGGSAALVVVDNGLGNANVLAVAWLVSSTVLTLDLVNGAELLVVDVMPVVRVAIVVAVNVKLDMSVRLG